MPSFISHRYPDNGGLQLRACTADFVVSQVPTPFSAGRPEFDATALEGFALNAMESGFVEALFEAVRAHPTNEELHLHAWSLLKSLTRLSDDVPAESNPAQRVAAMTRIKDAGTIDVVEIVTAAKTSHSGYAQILFDAQAVSDQWKRFGTMIFVHLWGCRLILREMHTAISRPPCDFAQPLSLL